jgi:stage V sporulation protein G
VFPVREEKLKAFVSVVFDRCFMVNDIKIIQGKDSLFVSMPSRKKRNGEFKDVAHPLNHETRRWLEERLIGEYRAALDGAAAAGAPAPADGEGGAAAAGEPANGDGPRVELSSTPTLEEVERRHLNDSFWEVG